MDDLPRGERFILTRGELGSRHYFRIIYERDRAERNARHGRQQPQFHSPLKVPGSVGQPRVQPNVPENQQQVEAQPPSQDGQQTPMDAEVVTEPQPPAQAKEKEEQAGMDVDNVDTTTANQAAQAPAGIVSTTTSSAAQAPAGTVPTTTSSAAQAQVGTEPTTTSAQVMDTAATEQDRRAAMEQLEKRNPTNRGVEGSGSWQQLARPSAKPTDRPTRGHTPGFSTYTNTEFKARRSYGMHGGSSTQPLRRNVPSSPRRTYPPRHSSPRDGRSPREGRTDYHGDRKGQTDTATVTTSSSDVMQRPTPVSTPATSTTDTTASTSTSAASVVVTAAPTPTPQQGQPQEPIPPPPPPARRQPPQKMSKNFFTKKGRE